MAIVTPLVADRVRETSTTAGTGSLQLLGAVSGFQSFTAAFTTGSVVYYCIIDGVNWEVGYGTFTTGAPATVSRTAVLASTNANALITCSGSSKDVFCTWPGASASFFPVQYNSSAPTTPISALPTGTIATTPLFTDNSTLVATTAFVNNKGVSYNAGGLGLAANTTLTATQMGGWGEIQTAAITITMPVLATIPVGISFSFKCAQGATVKGNGSELINYSGGVNNSVTVTTGEYVSLVSNGTSWYVIEDSPNFPVLKNTWTKAQIGGVVALSVASNLVAIDLSLSNNFSLTLQATTAQTLSNPTNAVAGQSGQIAITQNAVPSTLAYGTNWISIDGSTMPVSTTASTQNLLSYYVVDSTHIWFSVARHGIV